MLRLENERIEAENKRRIRKNKEKRKLEKEKEEKEKAEKERIERENQERERIRIKEVYCVEKKIEKIVVTKKHESKARVNCQRSQCRTIHKRKGC